jgi:hypothetical protein
MGSSQRNISTHFLLAAEEQQLMTTQIQTSVALPLSLNFPFLAGKGDASRIGKRNEGNIQSDCQSEIRDTLRCNKGSDRHVSSLPSL